MVRRAGTGLPGRIVEAVMKTPRRLLLIPLTALVLAACGPGGGAGTPSASGVPTPTPIGSPVASLDEAARVVIASDPRFAGVTKLDPNLIGASAWWVGEVVDGGFSITITIGWGDCPAGCLNRHEWQYRVTPDASLTLVSETWDALPAGSLPG